MHAQKKPLTLTIKDAIVIALDKNVEIEVAENNYTLENRRKIGGYAGLLPTLEFRGGANQVTGRNFDQVSGEVRTETGEFANASFFANWNILNVVESFSRVRASKYSALSRLWELEDKKDFTILAVARNYLEILQNSEQSKIITEAIATQEKNLKYTEVQVSVGARTKQDLYNQKAELGNLKSTLLVSENLVETGKNELILLLKLDPDTELILENNFLALEAESYTQNKTVEEFYEIALVSRNSLKTAEANMKAQKYLLSQNRGVYYPSISLFYSYGTNFSSFQDGGFDQQFFTDNITEVIGINLNIPILGGLQNRNRVYEAKVNFNNAKLNYEQLKKEVYVEISNIVNTIESNQKEKLFREEQLVASELNFELEQQRYELGAGTPVTLSIAQRDYIESALLLNQVKYRLIYNMLELDFFNGQIQLRNLN